MLITTTPPMFGASHREVIKDKIASSDILKFAVAFVKKSGVDLFRDEIVKCIKERDGEAKLICSSEFGITDPSSIEDLRSMGVRIRIHSPSQGVFHPKLWLFRSNERWACLIGSANFSYAAFNSNIEIGVLLENDPASAIVGQANKFFERLWETSQDVNDEILGVWKDQNRQRVRAMRNIVQSMGVLPAEESYGLIESFVKSWIDNGKASRDYNVEDRRKSKIWRGWYIIPDQGYIDNDLVQKIVSICSIIKDSPNGQIDVSVESADPALRQILEITDAEHVREERVMQARDLFIRQEKNYLVNLNFAHHPFGRSGAANKGILILSDYGYKLAETNSLSETKTVYTEAVQECQSHGLSLLKFTRAVLAELGPIKFNEFSYFINHIFSWNDINAVVSMVRIYRNLPDDRRADFDSMYDNYFSERLETGRGVRMNYDKHVKHTMSALGWCSGLSYDQSERILRMDL